MDCEGSINIKIHTNSIILEKGNLNRPSFDKLMPNESHQYLSDVIGEDTELIKKYLVLESNNCFWAQSVLMQ